MGDGEREGETGESGIEVGRARRGRGEGKEAEREGEEKK
jgi:hypothetical protein